MHLRFWTLVAGIVLAAASARATVTLQFSQPSAGGIASGFSTQAGAQGIDGLKWGIVVDTDGNGFSGNGTAYHGLTAGPNTAAFLSIDGTTSTDDYFFPASVLTEDYSAFVEGGVSPAAGNHGTVGDVASIPVGEHGISAGDRFAIVWFGSATTVNGDRYGFFTDDSFQMPANGSTSPFDILFVGVDPIRNATNQFGASLPAEIAVFDGNNVLAGNARADNVGTFSLDTVGVGSSSASQTFTIKNTGNAALTGIGISKGVSGNPGDFVLNTTGTATTLQGGDTTTFTVTFSPTLGGIRSAVIAIASSDANENPFEINVTGSASGLALNSGMAIGVDDPATALNALPGSTVIYSVNVAAALATSEDVVVWVPVPESSNGAFLVTPANISNGGQHTASTITVGGAEIPANSVYWDLDELTVAEGQQALSFEVGLSGSVPLTTTYTTMVAARTATQPSMQDTPLVLTVGNPNLAPVDGTVKVTHQTLAAKTHVKVVFSNWDDAEDNVPLSFGVRQDAVGGAQTVIVADGTSSTVEFDLPTDPTSFNYVARIKDSLGHVTLVPFTVGVPEIEVQQPSDVVIADEGSVGFGNVGVGISQNLTFTIKNRGAGNLTGLTITKDFANAAMFTVTANPTVPVAAGETTMFTVRFTPTSAGDKVAKIHIASNDANESPYDITLNGTGMPANLPVVVTSAANPVSFTGATLNGTVDANGSERAISFEYGLTTAYGNTVTATPSTLSTDTATPVSAVVSGLQPHKKYNFRVKASGALGAANGLNQTFTTGNNPPVAAVDNFSVLPGIKIALPVLLNDDDVDEDTLTITAFSQLSVPAAGKLTKSGNALFFTAATTFTGAATASFTYTISDGFGLTSTAQVNLSAATFSITPLATTMPSKAGQYTITVDDTLNSDVIKGVWSVTEAVPWATVSPMSGVGDGIVTVTLLPNATVKDRPGVITIAGIRHDITQSGVQIPELHQPNPDHLTGIVGKFYSLLIPTDGAPVTYKVSKLPAGLKMDNATGIISGIPTQGSLTPYSITISASNAKGPAPQSITFNLVIKPIPAGAVGSFHGLVGRNTGLNNSLGSRFELTTTAVGSYSGKIITGTTSQSFAGKLNTDPNNADHPSLELNIVRKGKPTLTLDLSFDAVGHALEGSLSDDAAHSATITGWHNGWNSANLAGNFKMLHTFSIEVPLSESGASLPLGYGYGSFSVKETTGALTIAGSLPDGSAFTTTTFLGQDGQILIYHPLYNKTGSLAGVLQVNADNTVQVAEEQTLSWFKPAPLNAATSKDTVYKDGFGPIDLTVEGAEYVVPAKGDVVMALLNEEDNASLDFADELGTEDFAITFDLLNPSPTGLTNKATIPPHANKVNLPTIKPATGAFSGDFTIPGTTAALNRKVTFQGLIVQHSDGIRGFGYFLLPELPGTGQKLTTTPKHSGSVLLLPLKQEP